ncbi:CYTH domain-containing protein [Nocardiopsis sp. EMB25]|uniref:class IV adenylate cyclase n=1 Tax=Nocardiopsis sp. EMB25 TaxID=2835867 RepID=UPI002283BEDC|nr:CYTH domain-containing protein [Nocardiopsis sp. EMB25]MCY9785239.1 CYTH domain-containing protein [Nocardiopsis sp. EMB25]
MREIETKYRVEDLEEVLLALKTAGVELGEPVFQDDQAYAPAGWRPEMGKVGRTFARLRSLDSGAHVFTTKTPLANSMECAEHETVVADRDQMHAAVLAMGYEPTVRIVKHRRTGAAGPIGVCVDTVEDVGTFVELELVIDDDRDGLTVQAELDAWARGLGVELERTTDTYDTLVRAAA